MYSIDTWDTPLFPISTAARPLGISDHTLTRYDKEGLIISFKKDSHHRQCSEEDIEKLSSIRKTIREEKISINVNKIIYPLIPFRDLINCSESNRTNCDAYKYHMHPFRASKHKKIFSKKIADHAIFTGLFRTEKIKASVTNISRKK